MKEGWTYKRLGDLCRIRTGKLDANAADDDGLYPFFTCSVTPLRINKYAYDCECVLVAGNGDLNVKYYSGKFNAYQRTYIIESNDKNVLDVRYLYMFLSEHVTILRKKSIGAIIKYIKLGYLTEAKLLLPPISEQRAIVARLDSAFAQIDSLKANAEKQLSEARKLFQKALEEAMTPKEGWEEKTFGDIIRLQSGDNLPTKKIEEGEYPVFGGNGVAGFHKYFNKEGNIIVVGRVGALCGNVHYVETPFWLTDNGFEVIVNKDIDVEMKFLSRYLIYLDLGKYARQTAQPVISNASLRDVKVFVPPLSTQHSIVAHLDSLSSNVRALEEKLKKMKDECDALKQAMLREVFE